MPTCAAQVHPSRPPPPPTLQEPTQEASRGERPMEKAGGHGPFRRQPGRML